MATTETINGANGANGANGKTARSHWREGRRVAVVVNGARCYPLDVGSRLFLGTEILAARLGGSSAGWSAAALRETPYRGRVVRFVTLEEWEKRFPSSVHCADKDSTRIKRRGKRAKAPTVAAVEQPDPRRVPPRSWSPDALRPMVEAAINLLSNGSISDESARNAALEILRIGVR